MQILTWSVRAHRRYTSLLEGDANLQHVGGHGGVSTIQSEVIGDDVAPLPASKDSTWNLTRACALLLQCLPGGNASGGAIWETAL